MQVDLDGRSALILGVRHAIAEAVAEALRANGAQVEWMEGCEAIADREVRGPIPLERGPPGPPSLGRRPAPEAYDILILSHEPTAPPTSASKLTDPVSRMPAP